MIYGRRKYGNQKTEVSGKLFDSKKEGKRYAELRLLERAGEISDLQTQVPFELIPAQRDENGRLLEKSVVYRADFTYMKGGQFVVEDAKGYRTDTYVLKRKLMLKVHGIRILET